ncbi:Crp/Fnr family transcriptional regulator [Chryseobacterium foetidum]|uniref:Crp/Fnr family transcriptional regulator n=1 Tax=Chryseobacterium foetidum TaxID=2951057 RepID=UPI0021CA8D7B|nr:Crp/Fnr family transcriptional regulator [Chryseobacterium foetidum]
MVISEDILFENGAEVRSYSENEIIFSEGTLTKKYFQILEETVKINNTFDDGKEFVHGFPFKGHCIGESYLYTDTPYGIGATALATSEIIILTKSQYYFTLIQKKPEIILDVNRYTAERLHFRYLISSFLSVKDPVIKIQKLLDHLKNYFGHTEPYSFQVPYTRYQLATLTGLRLETIIRIIKKMQSLKILKIEHSKIY